ncbi:enoyl-CoA hydratase/isomerase [Dactylonectria estremocensis]|uniref:Enoyl-CoA hydratase/isomerase n=1 Tax=Dactylonectria estremocensis TaxID=1079267 RepID=A0A9P9DZJ5_9HYPO|nr:enoyl-CoA hydratase/isomerase [Dactylonectria estremocensis]
MSVRFPTKTQPPQGLNFLRLTSPAKFVLLARMDHPSSLNALSSDALRELDSVLDWYDTEPSLRVLIVTGTGRAFTAGADLKEWRRTLEQKNQERFGVRQGVTPFTRRKGKKPIVAAVNGLAFGGGCEFIVNCDLVVAADTATFALPEVKRGLAPTGGVLTRLVHTVGMQLASEIVLTGRRISAHEMHSWGIVNKVVPETRVLDEALRYASQIAENSPDGVICARAGLRQAWETADVETATEQWLQKYFSLLEQGENIREGLAAFVQKRSPVWKDSKL